MITSLDFKTKHSADMCIFTVKIIIKYYTGHNTPAYTCFLDASKAFDRVNNWTLFTKLIYSDIPLLIAHICSQASVSLREHACVSSRGARVH